MRQKADTIDVGWHGDTSGFADCRQEICAADQISVYAALLHGGGPVRNARDMCAAMSGPAFASFEVRALEATGDAPERAVIANENQERVFTQLEFIELRDDATNHLIRISRHISEVLHVLSFILRLRRWIPVGTVRSRLKGAVREHHRIVQKKRLLTMPRDEVERKVVDERWPVFTVGKILLDSVVLQTWICISRRAASVLPQAGFVEAKMPGRVDFTAKLPFAADAGDVAGVFEQGAKRRLRAHQRPEIQIVADVVATRHQLHARRRTQRLHMTVLEADTRSGKFVKVWRLVRLTSIRRDAFVPEVIRHDQDDIWPGVYRGARRCKRCDHQCDQKYDCVFH